MKTLKLLTYAALAISVIGCSGKSNPEDDPKDPEEQKFIFDTDLFEAHTDESSGVLSYILKSEAIPWENSQSNYFNMRSMTNDERFIFFFGSNKDFSGDSSREGMILDLKTRKCYRVVGCRFSCCPYLDPVEDKLYFAVVTDKKSAKFYRRDLLVDPNKNIELATFPVGQLKRTYSQGTTSGPIKRLASHLTLTKDKQKVFLDIRYDDDFFQGLFNLYTGEWEEWGHTNVHLTHGQLNPNCDTLAMCAVDSYTKVTGDKSEVPIVYDPDGTYPRIQILGKGWRKTMTPDPVENYASHERWDESGKYVYWCSRGCCIRNLNTNIYEKAFELTKASHCFFSTKREYIAFDDQSPDFYRSCNWKVAFYNRSTGKMIYIHTLLPALVSKEQIKDPTTSSRYQNFHTDPHPQFVCNDKYIICTAQRSDGTIRLSVTPVQQLLDKTK